MQSLHGESIHWSTECTVNLFRFVETDQLGPTLSKALKTTGVKPATVEDCARALLFIAADKNIHGRLSSEDCSIQH
jgi:hypothetical protein